MGPVFFDCTTFSPFVFVAFAFYFLFFSFSEEENMAQCFLRSALLVDRTVSSGSDHFKATAIIIRVLISELLLCAEIFIDGTTSFK